MLKTFIRKLYLRYLYNTDQIKYAKTLGVRVGENCRLYNPRFGAEPYLIKIGDHVSATNVTFITHDGGVWVFRNEHPGWDIVKPIIIGNNVFIGYDVVILPGVTIGNNVVIGSRSVVANDIPDNVVYAGIPAKKIKPLDEYKRAIQNSIENTKNMTKLEKKKFYQNKFTV